MFGCDLVEDEVEGGEVDLHDKNTGEVVRRINVPSHKRIVGSFIDGLDEEDELKQVDGRKARRRAKTALKRAIK